MALRRATSSQRSISVYLGERPAPVGHFVFTRSGQKETCAFAYEAAWLRAPERFALSPDLPLDTGYQSRIGTKETSVFFGAIADSEPDGWGRQVIARTHAKRRRALKEKGLLALDTTLSALDYLLGVSDASRIGALRFKENGLFLDSPRLDGLPDVAAPPSLEALVHASQAVERGHETLTDLAYLQGRATSLQGMRPKATLVDEDGSLAIAKFPGVGDTRDVPRGEILALVLARNAGLDVASGRIIMAGAQAVAMITRFDRPAGGGRLPYVSAATLLQTANTQDGAYTDIADAIDRYSPHPAQDKRELWARICFSMLITNVDDHLHNHGFLYSGEGQWRLAPAFDINPFPDKEPVLKTWVTLDSGPSGQLEDAIEAAPYFGLTAADVKQILTQQMRALEPWRGVAQSAQIGMSAAEIEIVAPAFENANLDHLRMLI